MPIEKKEGNTIIYPSGILSDVLTDPKGSKRSQTIAMIILIILLSPCIIILDNIKETYGGDYYTLWYIGMVITLFCLRIILIKSLRQISINKDILLCKEKGTFEEPVIILWENVSKIRLNNEKILLIYNRDRECDYSFNITDFGRDDIQILINLLSKKTMLEVDTKIAKSEHYIVPDNLVDKKPDTTIRHRKITPNKEVALNDRIDKEIKRNLELKVEEISSAEKSSKRKLEL